MADTSNPTSGMEKSVDDNANSPPPPYRAVNDSCASPSKMEKKAPQNGNKTTLKEVTVETPTMDTLGASKSTKCSRAQISYISISLVVVATLLSALIYFILLHVNDGSPALAEPLSPGTTEAMTAADSACCFNPCMNSGQCKVANDTSPVPFICQCTQHYEGTICDKRIDACLSSPCHNGGTCKSTDTEPYFSCTCKISNEGDRCQNVKAFNQAVHTSATLPTCKDDTCKNGGTCSVVRTFIYCACASGYKGDRCQDIVPASSSTTTAATTTTTVASGS